MVLCYASFGARADKTGMKCSVDVCNSEFHSGEPASDFILYIKVALRKY